jgi:hypothetical protein
MANIYGTAQKQPKGGSAAPKSKQEALKMLNDMMSKRIQNKQSNGRT